MSKELPITWDRIKSVVLIWLLSLAISMCALITSCSVVVTRVTNRNCTDNGHHYTARYNRGTDQETLKIVTEQFADEHPYWKNTVIENAKKSTYIRDVCRYCGDTIEEQHGTQAEDSR